MAVSDDGRIRRAGRRRSGATPMIVPRLHEMPLAERAVEPHRSAAFLRRAPLHEGGTTIQAGALYAELLRDSRETGGRRTAYAICKPFVSIA